MMSRRWQGADVARYLAAYIVWALVSALGIWLIFQLRINLLELVVILRLGPWIMGAVDKFGIFILGLIWLTLVVPLESYFRNGASRRQLAQRTVKVLAIELALLGLSYAFQALVA
ncbi:MAG: hypothetical protein Kow0047_27750 [Anaerolineae bacterium]